MAKGQNFRGQQVTQFIVKFAGKEDDIDIDKEEITKYKWVGLDELEFHLIFDGQWENIKEVLEKSSLDIYPMISEEEL